MFRIENFNEILNNEKFSISPSFSLNRSDLISLKGELEKIIPQETTVEYSIILENISIFRNDIDLKEDYIDSSLMMTSNECDFIQSTIRIQRKTNIFSVFQNLKNFLNQNIAPLKLSEKLFFTVKFYHLLAVFLLFSLIIYTREAFKKINFINKFVLIIFTSTFSTLIIKLFADLIK